MGVLARVQPSFPFALLDVCSDVLEVAHQPPRCHVKDAAFLEIEQVINREQVSSERGPFAQPLCVREVSFEALPIRCFAHKALFLSGGCNLR
jgi:hypothetical protein